MMHGSLCFCPDCQKRNDEELVEALANIDQHYQRLKAAGVFKASPCIYSNDPFSWMAHKDCVGSCKLG